MHTTKDEKWMELCKAGAQIFSTCSKAQYFSLIIDDNQQIIGQGYNGVPSRMLHCVDGGCPRAINNVPSGTDYNSGPGLCFSAHAEQNALSRGDSARFTDATLYVNGTPCMGCARQVAASGIRRICIISDSDRLGADEVLAFLHEARIKVIPI